MNKPFSSFGHSAPPPLLLAVRPLDIQYGVLYCSRQSRQRERREGPRGEEEGREGGLARKDSRHLGNLHSKVPPMMDLASFEPESVIKWS
jgi:hypothetical protein